MTKALSTNEIRESFLSFFEGKGCRRLPSSSLIPDDPSLLLTAAGMVQFKPIFLGAKKVDFKRATTAQKCVRTTDIDIIGTTGRHLSFFEMLGNFSFGDYFKREAIRWSWEYSVDVLGLDPDRIWASVFTDDDEAAGLWLEETPIPPERIVRFGEEDNFWAAGPTGPCGPCSELYYDQGESYGCGSPDCTVGCDCDRYVEYWNLVFMQYDRDEAGNLTPLPKQNIDTGMGLERMAAILQQVRSNFETDLFRSLLDLAEDITGVTYIGGDGSAKTDIALRILTDHARSVAFMIADGILPSNEGRGYVLRRLLRRAVRYGRLLGVRDPFMVRMVGRVIELMSGHYTELSQHSELILGIVGAEEERFSATLKTGLAYLDAELEALADGAELSGLAAFTLHDTYGFPIDLTLEIASEAGHPVDLDGFESEMEQQKERARAQVKDVSWTTFGGVYADLANEIPATEFTGYELNEDGGVVVALVREGKRVERLQAGEAGDLVLNRTPFYGEQGGQVGDTGRITTPDGAVFVVEDTRIEEKKLYVHRGHVETGAIAVEETVTAAIDVARRERIRRNHTATHLLHWALRMVVGEHVSQAGSFVSPERLRFDFTHFERLTAEQLSRVERLINAKIAEDHPVRAYETTLAEARDGGVTALFGEKYGEYVRVLEVGYFSKELCGGTHIGRSSEIGSFKIVGEESVGANLRRIEAVTSMDAYDYALGFQNELTAIAAALKVTPREAAARVNSLLQANRELKAAAKSAGSGSGGALVTGLVADAVQTDAGYRVVVASPTGVTAGDLRGIWDGVRDAGVDACVLLTMDADSGKAIYLAAATKTAVAAGFDAGAVVKQLNDVLGGRGGGKPAMAQGGSDAADAGRIAETLATCRASFSA
ncbi:MAG: alanine--tRNA ligase [Actinomycetes bacterium]|jgi:alanyl-tRNA synthetase|nr:alanine--tRNA ligase [Actinomycetes bacterium]